MKHILKTLVAAASIGVATLASAQMSENPPNVGEEIQSMGANLTRDIVRATTKLYAPLIENMPRDGVKVTSNQRYGEHERHVLDVYQPETSAGPAPAVVFIHGGRNVRGDKSGYANIGTYFARNGMVSVLANYRLAPEATWPNGAEDISGVITWIKENGSDFNIDSNRIFLMGSSSGAGHVASYIFFEENQLANDGVAGAILMSMPSSNLVSKFELQGEIAGGGYFGTDPDELASMSPVFAVEGRTIPLFIAFAELEPPVIQDQNMRMIQAVFDRDGMLPKVYQASGHNHTSMTRHFNTNDEALGLEIIEFLNTH